MFNDAVGLLKYSNFFFFQFPRAGQNTAPGFKKWVLGLNLLLCDLGQVHYPFRASVALLLK